MVGIVGVENFTSELEEALDDGSAVVQTAAIEAMLRMGERSVETPALSRMIAGTAEQRLQLLDLIVETGRPQFRDDIILRALRDLNARVQVRALELAVEIGTELGLDELRRLIEHDNTDVAVQAFLTLAHFDRSGALDLVLTGIRSTDESQRGRALEFARHLASASLWPTMRAYAAQEDDLSAQRLALIVLGHLGDPSAELPLRDILLAAEPELAAAALGALSHIPTQRAMDQPLRHRRDPRAAVRETALDEMIRQRRPTDDFEVFLDDTDAEISKRALVHMQSETPERASQIFSRALAETDDPAAALTALYRVSLQTDIRDFLDASSDQLMRFLSDEDHAISGLAARLLVIATSPIEMRNRLRRTGRPDALYALIEATYNGEHNFSELYTESMDHDIHAIRVAASLGILALGTEYEPPLSE
ncbi:MAG: HEAT repeat protein [Bradymonadia bacterium]